MEGVSDLVHPFSRFGNTCLALKVICAVMLLPEPGCGAPDADVRVYGLVYLSAHAYVTVVSHLHDVE